METHLELFNRTFELFSNIAEEFKFLDEARLTYQLKQILSSKDKIYERLRLDGAIGFGNKCHPFIIYAFHEAGFEIILKPKHKNSNSFLHFKLKDANDHT